MKNNLNVKNKFRENGFCLYGLLFNSVMRETSKAYETHTSHFVNINM